MSADALLTTPGAAPFAFEVELHELDEGRTLRVTGPGPDPSRSITTTWPLRQLDHAAWLDVFEGLAVTYGLRAPSSRQPLVAAPQQVRPEPVLTETVSPEILYGYGDPCVVRAPNAPGGPAWYMVVTSNDAPQSFPVLRSTDQQRWELVGFAFPQGRKPDWALDGPNVSDFWAPEIHRVGDELWLVFTARQADGVLAIGLAKSTAPEGPFTPMPGPLLGGGVIDSHLLVQPDGPPLLFWKEDHNDLWPGMLGELLRNRPELIERLFPSEEDRRTAALAAALQPWIRTLASMERFFVLQTLIEAVTADLPAFEAELARVGGDEVRMILDALRTRIFAQPLAPDGRSLVGERALVLQNDQPWEAHLIEGIWVTPQNGRYYLFYTANDFTTAHYGIGVAIADHPLGPYRKVPGPILRSSSEWAGPGHPCVAPGLDGEPRLFLHAFFPGAMGYKAFRAVLSCRLMFEEDRVILS